MLDIQDKRKIIQNAKKAAKRDGYNQVVYSCDDGTFSFCREASGKPTVPLFQGERIVGRILALWVDGFFQTTPEDQDATAVVLLAPLGLWMLFTKDIVIY